VNQTVDNMGFYTSLQACFNLHQLNHAHWAEIHENHYPVALPRTASPTGSTDADPAVRAGCGRGPVPSR